MTPSYRVLNPRVDGPSVTCRGYLQSSVTILRQMNHADMLAWWALILAIAALVFHVPLSMLAHYYLPKVEDYFASRSTEKLTKRIAKLHRKLAQLNDPKYFEELEWRFREGLFAVLYLLGMGLAGEAMSLFLATGAVSKTWFWQLPPTWPLSGYMPVIVVVTFFLAVAVAGVAIAKSANLRPSKRPKLRLEVQAQIEALKVKLEGFNKR
jgi:hypothetical protein